MVGRIGAIAGCLTVAVGASGFAVPLESDGGPLQYIYAVIVLIVAALVAMAVLWWIVGERAPKEAPAPPPPRVADDLTRIEGIGPKISGLLAEAGISTFAQLATTSVERLEKIIADADLTALADPGTWPAQARLAAEGEWERLDALQEELKGGRRE
jgi:hypothetical protein